jgi:hypothetical protein
MRDFYDYLDNVDVTPNAFHVLWCIANKRRPKSVNAHTELRNLSNNKLITETYIITEDGYRVLKDAEKLFGNGSIIGSTVLLSTDLADNITKYLDLFPRGKLPSGKSARANRKDIEKGFKWFFDNYDYSWDTILKATAYYVDTYEKNKFMYMRNSQYFIGKTNPDKTKNSELADYCEIILNGGYEEDTNGISEKVV